MEHHGVGLDERTWRIGHIVLRFADGIGTPMPGMRPEAGGGTRFFELSGCPQGAEDPAHHGDRERQVLSREPVGEFVFPAAGILLAQLADRDRRPAGPARPAAVMRPTRAVL